MKYLIVALALATLVGCGGGGSSTNCTFSDPQTATVNLDGQTWSLSGTTPTNNCPYPVYTFYGIGTISQSGNTITVSGTGFSLTGQISGNQIIWGGTISSGDETITISCTTVTASSTTIGSTMSFSGTSWTVDYGDGTCSGTADGTFTRES